MPLKFLEKTKALIFCKKIMDFPYKKSKSGHFFPIIDFNVYYKDRLFYTSALVDSGASVSVFTPDTAKALKITITQGEEIFLGGVGGRIKGYVHKLEFNILEKRFSAPVVFSQEYFASFNLLGRSSVFEKFRICFDENKKTSLHFCPSR